MNQEKSVFTPDNCRLSGMYRAIASVVFDGEFRYFSSVQDIFRPQELGHYLAMVYCDEFRYQNLVLEMFPSPQDFQNTILNAADRNAYNEMVQRILIDYGFTDLIDGKKIHEKIKREAPDMFNMKVPQLMKKYREKHTYQI